MNSDYIRQLFDKQSGYGSSGVEQNASAESKNADGTSNGAPPKTSNTLRQLFDNSGGHQATVSDNVLAPNSTGQPQPAYDHRKIATQTPFRTILKVAARRHADAIAVRVPNQSHDQHPHLAVKGVPNSDSGLHWSYLKLYEAAGLLAAALYDRGIRRGQVIALFLAEGVEVALFFWAAIRLGAILMPLSVGCPESPFTNDTLSRPPVAAIVVSSQADAEWWGSLCPSAKPDGLLQIVARDLSREENLPGWYSLGTLLRIWNLNADYILKNVDADAAREKYTWSLNEAEHTQCVGDHVAVIYDTKVGDFDCITSETLMERTSAFISEQGLIEESSTLACSDITSVEQFTMMASAFRAGASVMLSDITQT